MRLAAIPVVATLLLGVACAQATPTPTPTMTPTPTETPYVNGCLLVGAPPTPTPRPTRPTPTPTPTYTPGGPGEVESPPDIEVPPIPDLPLPEAVISFVDAIVSIAAYPPAGYGTSVPRSDGLLVSADGLVLTVLNYTQAIERIEVEVPGHGIHDATIERVDPSTGATLLTIDASGLPFSSLEGDAEVALGEPVWLLYHDLSTGKTAVQEGYAAPAINEGARDTMFALLHAGFDGYYGTLVVNRDGVLMGMVASWSWWGTWIAPSGPPPGPDRPVIRSSHLRTFLGQQPEDTSYMPVAVAYHGLGWISYKDSPLGRTILAGPLKDALRSLGEPASVEGLGQINRAVLGNKPGTVLELLFPQPQKLRTATGELVGEARYVAFWWDRGNGEPDVILCGAEPGYICGAFLARDLSELKAAVQAAPASSRSIVLSDMHVLPGYPYRYPLGVTATTDKESYHQGEVIAFTVTIQNNSAWPISADHLPPGIVIQTKDASRYWLQGSRAEITNLTIPAHETVTLEFPWKPEEGSALPPGEYYATLTWITACGGYQRLMTHGFTILED